MTILVGLLGYVCKITSDTDEHNCKFESESLWQNQITIVSPVMVTGLLKKKGSRNQFQSIGHNQRLRVRHIRLPSKQRSKPCTITVTDKLKIKIASVMIRTHHEIGYIEMKKILSIDGGGIKGVFPASFLSSIESTTGKKVTDYFDLIVGTSTGGIIAMGLGMGYSAQELLEFYEKLGPEVFNGSKVARFLRSIGFSKYSNAPLQKALESKFGNRKLGESKNRLVIPSLNLESGEVHVYKTAHHERFKRDYKESIVGIGLATSAAPTYFPTHRSASGIPLVDGGLWANNPMGLAVVEAIGVLGWHTNELKVLSIGCTTESLDIKLARKVPMGKAYWGFRVTDLFMSAQSSASLGTAQLLAGHANVIRVSPAVANGKFGLDVIQEIESLKGLGDSEARKALPTLEHFFKEKVEVFEPCYKII